jgi:predicted enzyme related to lactoylglutathione lyase
VRDLDRAVAFFNAVFQIELQPMETPDGSHHDLPGGWPTARHARKR